MSNTYKPKFDNQGAVKGHASNQALQIAIADGKHHDNEYLVKQFLRMLSFNKLLQGATPEVLATAINRPDVIEKLAEFETWWIDNVNKEEE